MKKILLLLLLSLSAHAAVPTNLDSVTVGSYLRPKTTGLGLGTSGLRWSIYTSAINTNLGEGASYINSSGVVSVNTAVSPTELGYLDGVTSAIQTQLNAKQASDTDLDALAANSTNGLWARTGAGTGAARTIGASAGLSISNGDGVSGAPALTCDVASGSQPGCLSAANWTTFNNKQANDGDLDALAALSGTNTIYYRSGVNTWSAVTISTGLDFTAGTLTATGGGGGSAAAVLTKTSGYSILTGDFTGTRLFLECNCTADCTQTLPDASDNTGYEASVVNVGTATCTVATTGSDTFGSNTDQTWELPPGGHPQAGNIFRSNGGTRWNGF